MAETICVTSSFSMYPEVHTSGESQIIMVTFRSVMSSLLNDYGRLLAHTDTNPSCPQCVRFLKKVNLVIFLYARTVGSQEILQLFVCCISTKNTMGVVLYTKPVARLQSEFPRVWSGVYNGGGVMNLLIQTKKILQLWPPMKEILQVAEHIASCVCNTIT